MLYVLTGERACHRYGVTVPAVLGVHLRVFVDRVIAVGAEGAQADAFVSTAGCGSRLAAIDPQVSGRRACAEGGYQFESAEHDGTPEHQQGGREISGGVQSTPTSRRRTSCGATVHVRSPEIFLAAGSAEKIKDDKC
ncbi:hypothetical protein AB0B50_42185 [Streptomyces sp. NPDC041068]|uniref:hypothetical protein n=1 Tax=Streptomyces sp. NPDC041068 TaxID=3155130 RepID=UPI00340E3178